MGENGCSEDLPHFQSWIAAHRLRLMFLRQTRRKKDGKTHTYWNIVENKRLDGGRVVQRHVLYLGEINSSQAAAWRKAIEVLDEDAGRARTLALFPEDRCDAVADDASVVRLRLSELRLVPAAAMGRVLAGRAAVAGAAASIGSGPSACRRAARARAGIRSCRFWRRYRLIAPGSEWRLHREWFGRSAMADLLGADFGLAEIHKLYACHDRLLKHKEALFSHLVGRWRDLFNVDFDVLLYDLTSTYFEINASDVPEGDKRRHGYSRDKRPDCLQVVIALVVTPERLAAGLRGAARQYRGQHDAADLPGQDRAAIRQGAADLGDGSRRADRGGAGRDAQQRSAGAVSGRNAEGTPDPLEKHLLDKPWQKRPGGRAGQACWPRTANSTSSPRAPTALPRNARCAGAS